ncbi:Bromodomain-containing protein [Aspergillus karnatakaensis]|uniref:putative transcription regulator BDF1 n=1 Tax=Aspergillus karnatakaensis TaxID=1810916 RepID=UPI003CCD0823
MATPPPEAPSVLKEEKPQLPPSPNGDSASDVGRTDVQASVNTKPSTKGNETFGANAKALNGHTPEQQNGVAAAASPPKSPGPPATETSTPLNGPSGSAPLKPASLEERLSSAADDAAGDNGGESNSPKGTLVSQGVPHVPSATPASAQSPQHTNTVKAELPHHPSGSAAPDGVPSGNATATPPATQSSYGIDQEMKDAPVALTSPAKLSREREVEPDDEPSAKRTKIDTEGFGFKVPDLPTPATEGPMDTSLNGDTTLTKVQHKFLVKAVQSLKRLHDARFYKLPVDPIKMNIPHYPQIIKQPMDLGTIEQKLKNNAYQDSQDVISDFHLMVQNSLTFNGPEHMVTVEGLRLRATFDKQMANLPRADEVEEKKPKKVSAPKTSATRREPRTSFGPPTARPTGSSPQATTFALGPEGLPLIRRDSTNADGRPKRSIHPPKRDLPYSTKPKKKKYQWELKFCQDVLDELHKNKHFLYAAPFYVPVDPVALNIPTYHSVIKKPMDLSTIQSKLTTGLYENAKEFEADIRQITKNCFKFNLKGDPTYLAGEEFEKVFNQKWSQKDRYLAAHEPQHEQHSAESSSEESDEEEDGTDDEEEEAINRLKKQIAEMSQQLEAMTNKKKKTPPKKTKSKKKDSKKSGVSGGSKKDKKSGSKSSKPEKARYVSYHEKQIISNGISSLPDKKMQEALKIIQSNVPALKGTQETEIELDIDELPNDVLFMLLKFVKKNAPHVVDDEDVSTPVAPNAAPPKPKKNKPMSKYEQEAQINVLESNLSRFQGGGSGRSPDPVPSVEANDSSGDSDEDDSEESEEE